MNCEEIKRRNKYLMIAVVVFFIIILFLLFILLFRGGSGHMSNSNIYKDMLKNIAVTDYDLLGRAHN